MFRPSSLDHNQVISFYRRKISKGQVAANDFIDEK